MNFYGNSVVKDVIINEFIYLTGIVIKLYCILKYV